MLVYIVMAVTAYLLGSIPTGYLVARAKGIDIRTVGSGNIGATNVFRMSGKPAGVFVLIADGLKGFAACTWLWIAADIVCGRAEMKVETVPDCCRHRRRCSDTILPAG